jgi:hypothetical protein
MAIVSYCYFPTNANLFAIEEAIVKAKGEGFTPFCVNATAGSTVLGVFDDIVRTQISLLHIENRDTYDYRLLFRMASRTCARSTEFGFTWTQLGAAVFSSRASGAIS